MKPTAAFWRLALAGLGMSLALSAHPMGNFSVNHYSRLSVRDGRAEIVYVLDLAEIPAFELFSQWHIDWKDRAALAAKSRQQAGQWVSNLSLVQSGRRLPLKIVSVTPKATEGAGGMPTLRISIVAAADVQPGEVAYKDANYPGRAGWKEIVTARAKDISRGLTYYPVDPDITPPQNLTARLKVVGQALPQPTVGQALPPTGTFTQQQPSAPGSVVRGDYLSKLLQTRNLGWQLVLLGIVAAFGLGAMHALSPGHGKTIVAAYLVGSRGTLKHAGLLGFVVTFTHTFTVFLLGLGVMFFQQYVVPEKIVPVLGVISGLSIVTVGVMLLYRRSVLLLTGGHGHFHLFGGHTHTHQYAVRQNVRQTSTSVDSSPSHPYVRQTSTSVDPSSPTHPYVRQTSTSVDPSSPTPPYVRQTSTSVDPSPTQLVRQTSTSVDPSPTPPYVRQTSTSVDPSSPTPPYVRQTSTSVDPSSPTHSHVPEGPITLASLITLGISGGLVPCPSALILMLSAIALGHPGLGLVLLLGFSSGLAAVLMGIGMLALYARNLLPDSKETSNRPIFRLIPVFSAVVVICLGLAMSAVSAGWVQPMRFLS